MTNVQEVEGWAVDSFIPLQVTNLWENSLIPIRSDNLARLRYLARHGNQLPDIMMFGTDSLTENTLQNLYVCIKNKQGDAKCKPRVDPVQSQPAARKQRHRPGPGLPSISEQLATTGSCLDQADCDTESNYICASDKGRCLLLCCCGASTRNLPVILRPLQQRNPTFDEL